MGVSDILYEFRATLLCYNFQHFQVKPAFGRRFPSLLAMEAAAARAAARFKAAHDAIEPADAPDESESESVQSESPTSAIEASQPSVLSPPLQATAAMVAARHKAALDAMAATDASEAKSDASEAKAEPPDEAKAETIIDDVYESRDESYGVKDRTAGDDVLPTMTDKLKEIRAQQPVTPPRTAPAARPRSGTAVFHRPAPAARARPAPKAVPTARPRYEPPIGIKWPKPRAPKPPVQEPPPIAPADVAPSGLRHTDCPKPSAQPRPWTRAAAVMRQETTELKAKATYGAAPLQSTGAAMLPPPPPPPPPLPDPPREGAPSSSTAARPPRYPPTLLHPPPPPPAADAGSNKWPRRGERRGRQAEWFTAYHNACRAGQAQKAEFLRMNPKPERE